MNFWTKISNAYQAIKLGGLIREFHRHGAVAETEAWIAQGTRICTVRSDGSLS